MLVLFGRRSTKALALCSHLLLLRLSKVLLAMFSSSPICINLAVFVAILFSLLHGGFGRRIRKREELIQERDELKKAIEEEDLHWDIVQPSEFIPVEDLAAITGAPDNPEELMPHGEDEGGHGRRKKQADLPIPSSWDWRDHPLADTCKSIVDIRDQGSCSACWAVATASMISDRYCLYMNGSLGQPYFSAYELMSCVDGCGPHNAYDPARYLVENGLVTGGDPTANEPPGCSPYPEQLIEGQDYTCQASCSNSEYENNFDEDKIKVPGAVVEEFRDPTVQYMQYAIRYKGPLVAYVQVYEDLMWYKSGVYVHKPRFDEILGQEEKSYGHFVKLIGWGTDEYDVDYWIVSNSWGIAKGENGFFQIRRGTNESAIEFYVVGVELDQEYILE